MIQMTSNKPYLLRATYEWIIDNQLTPYLLVDTAHPGLEVPQEHIISGQIIFNISPDACRNLYLGNDNIAFTACFSGKACEIFLVPIAILAIYAKENGKGMEFPKEEPNTSASDEVRPKRQKPTLTLIKKDKKD